MKKKCGALRWRAAFFVPEMPQNIPFFVVCVALFEN
jgi:hypothetical protein